MRLDESQRHELGKSLFDLGKLGFAIAVATPLVTSGIRAWRAVVVGGVFVVIAFVLATRLLRKEKS